MLSCVHFAAYEINAFRLADFVFHALCRVQAFCRQIHENETRLLL